MRAVVTASNGVFASPINPRIAGTKFHRGRKSGLFTSGGRIIKPTVRGTFQGTTPSRDPRARRKPERIPLKRGISTLQMVLTL